jgi:hypothetical protein
MADGNQSLPVVIQRDPTQEEIATFISNQYGDNMMQLMQPVGESAAQDTLTNTHLFTSSAITPSVAAPVKTKKALNAFVGFRSKFETISTLKHLR